MSKLVDAVLALSDVLPAPGALHEYVVAGNGLFVRAESPHLAACVPVCDGLALRGLAPVEPFVAIRPARIPADYLFSVLNSARRHAPAEVMYHFRHDGRGWACSRPAQSQSSASVDYAPEPGVVVDLHSHADMSAFFSATDDADEQGFGLYVVVGAINSDAPQIAARVGVFGHRMRIPADVIFDGVGPFRDTFADDDTDAARCRVCGCTDEHGCPDGCYWVEPDLCSSCVTETMR